MHVDRPSDDGRMLFKPPQRATRLQPRAPPGVLYAARSFALKGRDKGHLAPPERSSRASAATTRHVCTTPSSCCIDDALVVEGACENGRMLNCRVPLGQRGGVAAMSFVLHCLRERMLPDRPCTPSATRAWPKQSHEGVAHTFAADAVKASADLVYAPLRTCSMLRQAAPKPAGMTPHA